MGSSENELTLFKTDIKMHEISNQGSILSSRRSLFRAFKRFYQFGIYENPDRAQDLKILDKQNKRKTVPNIRMQMEKSVVFHKIWKILTEEDIS